MPCAEKSKFEKLIKDVELKIKELPREVIYSGGMTAMQFAKKLAADAILNSTMKKILSHWSIAFVTLIVLTYIGLQDPWAKEILRLNHLTMYYRTK